MKKYGFIIPDDGDKEVFVHLSALSAAGVHHLDDGTRVSFEIEESADRLSAVDLAVLAPATEATT